MPDSEFIDTSVLVYAFDESEPAKHELALKLISSVPTGKVIGTVSVQVLAELYNVITIFLSKPLPHKEASLVVDKFFKADEWVKLHYSSIAARRAIATAAECNVRVWAALIAETMKENGINTIVTENEKDFKRIPGIKVINPFR